MDHNYDNIPLSILIFQNNKIVYFNKHMKNIFIASNKDELIKAISCMLPIKTEENLFDFLIQNPIFKSNKNEYEVKYMKKEYDLFIFSKLNKQLINDSSNILLKIIKRNMIEMLSFVKGIKLYSNEEIVKVDGDKLIINISKKQLLNITDNKEFFVKINNESFSSKCSSYSKDKNIIILENFKKMKHDPFCRDEVRIKIRTFKINIPVINKDMDLYDISEKSICFISQEDYQLSNFTKTINIKVPFLEEQLYIYFMKKVSFKGKFKYIFHLNNQSKELVEFLHNEQKNILLNVSKFFKKH